MSRQTNKGRFRWSAPLIAAILLGGCVVAPIDRYGYEEEVVIVAPAPRIEYRGYPPVAGYLWIDGYWNRVGQGHHWVGGRWAPPAPRYHAPDRSRDRSRDHDRDHSRYRDDDRRDYRDHDRIGDRDRTRSRDHDRGETRNSVQPNNRRADTQRRGSAREQVQMQTVAPTRIRDRARDDRPNREGVAARPSEQSRDHNNRNSWRERSREHQQGETRRRGDTPWRTESR